MNLRKNVSRRSFLSRGTAAGTVGLVGVHTALGAIESPRPAGGLFSPPKDKESLMIEQLTLATFAPLVGGPFTTNAGPYGTLTLTLVEAASLGTESSPPGASAPREAFSLLFQGPAAPGLEQGIRELTHAALGTLGIFIVPVGPRGKQGAPLYQAIFA